MKKFTLLVSLLFIATVAFGQDVLMQNGTVNQCSGTFLDSGGAGNYSSNESFTLTICPDVAGNLIQVDFTSFGTQPNSDELVIYNGDSATGTPFGTFSGGSIVNSPGLVSATETNPTGCLTFVFTSDAVATTSGWEAAISCFMPCQTIVSQLDSSTPTPNGDGYIRVCPNEDITLNGNGNFSVDGTGATYEWDLGDGNIIAGQTATFSYPNPGVYVVNLDIRDTNTVSDPGGCMSTNLINQVIQVGTEPDFTGTQAADTVLCFGETTTIDGLVTPTNFMNDCAPPVSGTTVLPDQSGATYQTTVTVDCYNSNQTLTSVNQIVAVCINLEHSFSGDLDIFITSPNGQQTQLYNQGGGGTYFGGANNDDDQLAGVGADYCFSINGTVTVNNGTTVVAGSNPPGNSWAPGTYLPTGTFNTLIGSPLNGDWTLTLIDNLNIDDGTVFGWSIEFDPNLQPPGLSFTPATVTEGWDADPTITNTTGNTITVSPPTAGQFCYTYRTTDDFGCEYTEQVCIDVLPEIVAAAPNDMFLCNPGVPPFNFDLTLNDAVINAPATNPADQIITYYETQLDADNETNPIGNPTNYSSSAVIGSPQSIFVRVEYLSSDCFESSSFLLNITVQPTINPALEIMLCDDASNDGTEPFDLESQNLIILGTQLASDYTV
uniref:PKD domain-containing protein n=1 Tax=Lacinutrix sp. TaxID=1937692 RepID=UPI0025C5AF05